MAKKIKSQFRHILNRILTLLGITSIITACGGNSVFGGAVAMYGVPQNNYVIEGMVTDSSGSPVKGIRVGAKKHPDDTKNYDEYAYKPYSSYKETDENGAVWTRYNWSDYFEFTETDENGKYKLEWSLFPVKDPKFVLYAEDIDGAENGSYQEKSDDVAFTADTKIKDGSWTDYFEIKNKNLTLDSSEEE